MAAIAFLLPFPFLEQEAQYLAWLLFWIALLLAFMVWQGRHHRRQLAALSDAHTRMELNLLRSHINPHFFFNTLHNLHGLSLENTGKAPQMILRLAEVMRYTIYQGKKEYVTLGEEIAHIEDYIALHQMRLHRQCDIQFDYHTADPSLPIAPLLLITLVENAFKHGIETLIEKPFIHIWLEASGVNINFEAHNNFDRKSEDAGKGMGLANLRRRLELAYPGAHRMEIREKEEVFQVFLQLNHARL